MSIVTRPDYSITQTESHIHIHVVVAVKPNSAARAIAQGTTFGLVWGQVYLPLVLPSAASVAPGVDPVCQTNSHGLTVLLQKESIGIVAGLEELEPQILPHAPPPPTISQTSSNGATSSALLDAVLTRENQRRVERGQGRIVQVQESAPTRDGAEPLPSQAYSQQPVAPLVREGVQTQVHEVFLDTVSETANFEADNHKRRLRTEQIEDDAWNEGWFLDNYADEEGEVASILRWRAPWTLTPTPIPPPNPSVSFSPSIIHLVLLELLFSTLYDARTTQGDVSVESAWTISALSRSLVGSSLPLRTASVATTLRESYRRALTKPLFRNWDLNQAVASDVEQVLRRGRTSTVNIIKGALKLLRESGDEAMEVYVKDTVGPLSEWLQSSEEASSPTARVSDEHLALLSQQLQQARTNLTQNDVGGTTWDLDTLQQAAAHVMAEDMERE